MWALVRADVPSLSINLSRVDQNRNLVRGVLSGKSQIEHHSGSRMPIGVVHRYGLGIGQPAKEEEKADPFHVSLRFGVCVRAESDRGQELVSDVSLRALFEIVLRMYCSSLAG